METLLQTPRQYNISAASLKLRLCQNLLPLFNLIYASAVSKAISNDLWNRYKNLLRHSRSRRRLLVELEEREVLANLKSATLSHNSLRASMNLCIRHRSFGFITSIKHFKILSNKK